jgi:hypothetical protein
MKIFLKKHLTLNLTGVWYRRMLDKKIVGATDKHPAIMVKPAILARSGIYVYGRDEMLAMGFTVKDDKSFYKVYRPPHTLIEAKDKFCFAVVTKEHTAFDTSPENFREQADGVVGDSVEVVTLDDGNIGLKGRIAFYTKDVADYFESGNKETSAQYHMALAPSSDPVKDGYDFVMVGIESVNSLAITSQGRGGGSVRVLDSMAAMNKFIGGNRMKGGFLSFLGIGKTKDAGFKFSDALFGGISKVRALDASDSAGIEKAVGEVMAHVVSLGDSEAKEVLAGAVSDCLKNAEAVLAKRDDVAKKIDALYGKCQDADAEVVKRILDADGKGKEDKEDPEKKKEGSGDEKKEEGESKDALPKDFDAVIGAAIDKAFSKFGESIDAKIDAAMKKALGTETAAKPAADTRTVHAADSAAGSEDASYLVRGVFGNR